MSESRQCRCVDPIVKWPGRCHVPISRDRDWLHRPVMLTGRSHVARAGQHVRPVLSQMLPVRSQLSADRQHVCRQRSQMSRPVGCWSVGDADMGGPRFARAGRCCGLSGWVVQLWSWLSVACRQLVPVARRLAAWCRAVWSFRLAVLAEDGGFRSVGFWLGQLGRPGS